jgi:hypothetical protein
MLSRPTRLIPLLVFLGLVSALLAYCFTRPSYNWDILAYAGVVLDDGKVSPEALHAEVYRIASEEIPEEEYRMMVDTTHQLRHEVLRSPERFYQFLSYFRVKPLYAGLCNLFYSIGVPLTKATVLPSILGIFVLALLLFYRFSRNFPSWAAAILGLSMLCMPPVLEAARLSTPDALSAVVLLGAFLVYLYGANVYWFMLLVVIAVLARLDNAIVAIVLLLCLIVRDYDSRKDKSVALISICLMAIIFAYAWIILRYAEYNNGFEQFYGGLTRKWNPIVLIGDAVQGLKTIKTSHVAIAGISFVVLFYRNGLSVSALNRPQFLFVVTTIAFAARYVFFPDLTTRLILSYYILCWLFIVERMVEITRPTDGRDTR